MFKNLIDTFKEVARKNRLRAHEQELQKLGEKRAELKVRGMKVQKAYDSMRGMA